MFFCRGESASQTEKKCRNIRRDNLYLHFRLLFVTLIMFILLFYIKCLLSYILDYNCNKPFLSSYSALCFLTKALSTPTLSFLCSVKLNPNIFPILN